MNFEFVFFHDIDRLPSKYETLLENSDYEYSVTTEYKFILIEGRRIPVMGETGSYYIDKDDVAEYLRETNQKSDKQSIRDRFNSITKDINNKSIPVITQENATTEIWKPKSPPLGQNTWVSLMVDKSLNKIIGTYKGAFYEDSKHRRYSGKQYLEISPQYRGKGLCTNFAKYTYDQLGNTQGENAPLAAYLCLVIGASEKVAACRCYTAAALSLGFTVYSTEGPLQSKENCTVYDSDTVWHMIIVPPFVNYEDDDEILQKCLAFEL